MTRTHRSFAAPLVSMAFACTLLAAGGCSESSTSSPGSGGAGGSSAGQGGSGGAPGTGGAGTAGGAGGAGGSGGGTGGASSTGSGGGAGMAGAGGSPGDAGSGDAGGAGGALPAGVILLENFDTGMVGKQPAGWDNFIAYVKNAANPSGETLALVDNSRAHSGTNSMKFHGGTQPAMITRPLPPGTNKLYVRAYFYLTRQLGMNPGANHETLIGIRKTPGFASDEVRFGEIKGAIGTNEVPSDNISPKMELWGRGPVIAANRWACIEVAFLADQPQHTLTAWADGAMVHSVTAPDQWQNGALPMNWMNGKFVEVILGWQSFSSVNIDVWMDDLVLSTRPIGCN